MTVLARVNQISKTIKNMGRFRQILGTFVKHGFADLIERTHLQRFVPSQLPFGKKTDQTLHVFERLRTCFEELGPTFIKLGQVLSTRGDLFPPEFIAEMKKLQDNVPSFSATDAKTLIEEELGKPISQLFESFDEIPMAAASIAQVHAARTRDGDDVVIKVQRPNVAREIKTDVEILLFFANWVEDFIPEIRIFSPKNVIREFARSLKEEINFLIEANNIRRIKHNIRKFEKVRVPHVYTQLSAMRVLTLERFHGVRIDEIAKLKAQGVEPKEVVQWGLDAFLHMVLVDGLFHCDLHAGNVMFLEDNTIGLLDFGIVGRLSQRVRDQIIYLFLALFTENYENLAYAYVELAPSRAGELDIEAFQKDLMDALSPVFGMNISELDVGRVLMDAAGVAARHHLELPRDLILLFRALVTVQGMCRDLHTEFNIVEAASKHLTSVVSVRYSKDRILQDLLLTARDTFDLIQILPKQMRMFLRKLHHNQIGFQHQFPQLSFVQNFWSHHFLHKTYLFVACFFLFLGQVKLETSLGMQILGLSLYVWIPWVIAAFFFLAAVYHWWMLNQKKK